MPVIMFVGIIYAYNLEETS